MTRFRVALIAVASAGAVFGGVGAAAAAPSGTWTLVTTSPSPALDGQTAAVAPSGVIYVETSSGGLVRYTPSTRRWTTLAAPPNGIGSLAWRRGRLYLIHEATVDVYDPQTASWTAGPRLPKPRSAPAVGVDGRGRIYVIGGYTVVAGEPVSPARSVYRLGAGGRWRSLEPLPRNVQTIQNVTPAIAVGPRGGIFLLGVSPTTWMLHYAPWSDRWRRILSPAGCCGPDAAAVTVRGTIVVLGSVPGSRAVWRYSIRARRWLRNATPFPRPISSPALGLDPRGGIDVIDGAVRDGPGLGWLWGRVYRLVSPQRASHARR
jgi:hypothetical protein